MGHVWGSRISRGDTAQQGRLGNVVWLVPGVISPQLLQNLALCPCPDGPLLISTCPLGARLGSSGGERGLWCAPCARGHFKRGSKRSPLLRSTIWCSRREDPAHMPLWEDLATQPWSAGPPAGPRPPRSGSVRASGENWHRHGGLSLASSRPPH